MTTANLSLLTKDDYVNLAKILESVDVKGRKTAEYIAVLGAKLDKRVANWYEPHATGFKVEGYDPEPEQYDDIPF